MILLLTLKIREEYEMICVITISIKIGILIALLMIEIGSVIVCFISIDKTLTRRKTQEYAVFIRYYKYITIAFPVALLSLFAAMLIGGESIYQCGFKMIWPIIIHVFIMNRLVRRKKELQEKE